MYHCSLQIHISSTLLLIPPATPLFGRCSIKALKPQYWTRNMLRLIICATLATICTGGLIQKMEPALWSLSDELDKSLKKPLELRFTSHTMTDQILEAGSELELKCEVISLPTAVVMWQFNGKLLDGHYETTVFEKLRNVGKETIQHGTIESRLRIPCVDKSNQGKYKCFATNGRTTIEQSARIAVEGTAACIATPQPPYIQTFSVHRFENEGNSVQLLCRSQKDAVIAWYNEDRELLNNKEGFEVMPNGDLLIKEASFNRDLGTYTCVASNDVGEDRAEIFFYPTAVEGSDETDDATL